MGNIFNKDPNQLDFKGIHTENFSDNIPYLNKLQKESTLLANQISNSTSSNNSVNNRKMYEMFNKKEENDDFSDTSSLIENSNADSATSAPNTEIKHLLNNLQKGGYLNNTDDETSALETEIKQLQRGGNLNTDSATSAPNTEIKHLFNNLQQGGNLSNEQVNFINNSVMQDLLTETFKNQTGGNLQKSFLNEEMLRNLMTETNEQSGGFFWNKKKDSNETFINEDTFKKLINNNNQNDTSEVNTEFNNYMNNAVTELTSVLENNTQKGGGDNEIQSESEDKSSSDSSGSDMSKSPLEEEIKSSIEMISPSNEESPNNMSMGRNNYDSSSAHSNEIDSNSNMSSTITESNKYLSDSINTSDINMISVE
jgi:hypothetical protein